VKRDYCRRKSSAPYRFQGSIQRYAFDPAFAGKRLWQSSGRKINPKLFASLKWRNR
jgi:hypothetical protein